MVVGKLFNLMQYHSVAKESEVSICNNHLNMGHKHVLRIGKVGAGAMITVCGSFLSAKGFIFNSEQNL